MTTLPPGAAASRLLLETITPAQRRHTGKMLDTGFCADCWDTDGASCPPLTPAHDPVRFSTAWEREDYEREKRGEKPLGPYGCTDECCPHCTYEDDEELRWRTETGI